jgi:hypothetical protein
MLGVWQVGCAFSLANDQHARQADPQLVAAAVEAFVGRYG